MAKRIRGRGLRSLGGGVSCNWKTKRVGTCREGRRKAGRTTKRRGNVLEKMWGDWKYTDYISHLEKGYADGGKKKRHLKKKRVM